MNNTVNYLLYILWLTIRMPQGIDEALFRKHTIRRIKEEI
jgi:hypothetical protein